MRHSLRRRTRFRPGLDALSGRVLPDAGPIGMAADIAPADADPDPAIDPMAPGGPDVVALTDAVAVAPHGAFD
jgi:hypothetical protein